MCILCAASSLHRHMHVLCTAVYKDGDDVSHTWLDSIPGRMCVLYLLFVRLIFLSHTHSLSLAAWTFLWIFLKPRLSLSLCFPIPCRMAQCVALFVLQATALVPLKHSSHITKTGCIVPTARVQKQTSTRTIKSARRKKQDNTDD